MKKICYISIFLMGIFYNPEIVSPAMVVHKSKSKIVDPIEVAIKKHSKKYQVDEKLIRLVIETESNFRQNVKSHKGAIGLMQLMPSTAKWLEVDPHTIDGNIEGGVKYLAMNLKTYKKPSLALAAYNAGPGNVNKYGKKIPPYKETLNYVKKICSKYICPHYEDVLYIQQFKG